MAVGSTLSLDHRPASLVWLHMVLVGMVMVIHMVKLFSELTPSQCSKLSSNTAKCVLIWNLMWSEQPTRSFEVLVYPATHFIKTKTTKFKLILTNEPVKKTNVYPIMNHNQSLNTIRCQFVANYVCGVDT